jgi:hypothetical protein
MNLVTPQGATVSWGTTRLDVISVSLSAEAGSEIEMTSMSSKVRQDPNNFRRNLITRDYDVCFDGGRAPSVSFEFLAGTAADSGISLMDVGSVRDLQIAMTYAGNTNNLAINITKVTAFLTQVQLTGSAGEYVRGSATFKLSGL